MEEVDLVVVVVVVVKEEEEEEEVSDVKEFISNWMKWKCTAFSIACTTSLTVILPEVGPYPAPASQYGVRD